MVMGRTAVDKVWYLIQQHRRSIFYLATVTVAILWSSIVPFKNDVSAPAIQISTAAIPSISHSDGHLIASHDENHWTAFRSQDLPLGIRIAFRTRDTGEFGIRTDDSCYKNPEDLRRNWERTRVLPPTLIDERSAREWEEGHPTNVINGNKCGRVNGRRRSDNIRSSIRGGRILDFTTSVATDLKILFLGDSVAEQFGRGFESACSGVPGEVAMMEARDQLSNKTQNVPASPKVLLEIFDGKSVGRACVFASAPVRGGGAVGMWRVVNLFSMSREGMQTCNSFQGGWKKTQLLKMLEHKFHDPEAADENRISQMVKRVGQFDAIVLRIQLGWMKPRAITREGILESITLCRDFLEAQTVVIMTINFTNDVHNPNEWAWAGSMNKEIRGLAQEFNQNSTDSRSSFRVQIMEFSDFTTQVHWANARTILAPSGQTYEYPNLCPPNVSLADYEQKEEAKFLFDRFKPWHLQNKHPHSIATVCARMKDKFIDPKGIERRTCTRNAIMADGLHWCMSSVGPRYHAGLACLLGCAYNDRNDTAVEEGNDEEIEKCERACNERFMSLVPIDEAWLEEGTTLFSRS